MGDPLRHLFADWVPYYRLKWAVSKVLQPSSILEVGVRFGYSALAFLDASPSAWYVGIDNNSIHSGGVPGAVVHARASTRRYRADFVIADSQTMERFPGTRYDLIHVDGQQDGSGSFHDLELAIHQARFILADGYYWSRSNFLAMSEFLYRYRDLIEFFGVIPGYAGELLIKLHTHPRPHASSQSSRDLKDIYTAEYYLSECEGFDAFKRSGGLTLESPGLMSIGELAIAAPRGRALDLGCGRGEMSVFLAREGFEVTGIDYSTDAIRIAQEARARIADPSLNINLAAADLSEVELTGNYQLAVAADLIEHLSPDELDRLYSRLAHHLAAGGLFLIHTYPNSWFYRYDYPRRRKIAESVGSWLPPDPRTRYESLMHINEQSPQGLRRQLRRYFEHVLVWFGAGDGGDVFDNLARPYLRTQMRSAGHLYAAATHSAASLARLRDLATTTAPVEFTPGTLMMEILDAPQRVKASEVFSVTVRASNQSGTDLKSRPPFPVYLSYHWLDSVSRTCVIFEGRRTRLFPALLDQCSRTYTLQVEAPGTVGQYLLQCTFVHEYVRWMDSHTSCETAIEVAPHSPLYL